MTHARRDRCAVRLQAEGDESRVTGSPLPSGAAPALANPSDGGPVDTDVDEDDGYDMPSDQVKDPDELQYPDDKPRAHDEIKFPDAQPRAHDEIIPDKPNLPDADAP